jgi:hypothetical protein
MIAGTEELLEDTEARVFADLYAACPADVAAEIGLSCRELAGATVLSLRGVPYPMFNRVIALGLHQPVGEQTVDQLIELYRAGGMQHFYLHLSPTLRGGQVEQWLVGRGFNPMSHWSKLRRDNSPTSATPTTLQIRQVTEAERQRFGETVCRGYGLPVLLAPWFGALVSRSGWRCYLAWDDDAPVAAAALHVLGKIAWLGLTSTLPSHRRRGGQSALMVARINDAITAGCTDIVTEAGSRTLADRSPALDNMLRAGFAIEYERANFAPNIESRRHPTLP